MRALRFDRLLTTTALALALAAASGLSANAGMTEAGIAAAVPMPDPANVPPPTARDVKPNDSQAAVTPAEIEARVPMPESANLPPPSISDLGPTTGTTSAPPPKELATQPPAVAPVQATSTPPTSTPPAPAQAAPTAAPAQAAPAPVVPAQDAAAPPAAAPAEDPVATALRGVITTKLARLVERKNERTAIEQFYAKRGYAPLWSENGEATPRVKAAIDYLASVDEEGLDPTDYPTPVFRAGADPATLAEADLRLTDALMTFARHAQSGRVHWTRISADIFYGHTPPEPAETLAKIAEAKDLAATLADFNPPHAGYKALKAKLAEVRGRKGDTGPAPIPHGRALKIGMDDNRVPAVRERLGATGDPRNTAYDKDVADAVKKFQQEKKLKQTGILTDAVIDAINGPRRNTARDADLILANMERWRWLPRELANSSGAYVMLNIPDFTLRVHHNGQVAWQTRVVVGAPKTPTPILTETMKYITVNPTWNVPPSIVYNEYLPALQQDPTVLQRMGLKLSQNPDGSVHISQPPGERNALGRIRFNFPNRFLVYQHDTPDKMLFGHEKRAYSHGCMRVQDPAKYAEVLLAIARPHDGYTQDRIKKMFGNSEVDIQLPVHIPVHITYQTAYVDDAGKLVIRDDVYGRDARVLAALKDERKVADIPMERSKPSYARPPVRLPSGIAGYGNSGPSFFDMLFGGNQQPPRPAARTSQQQQRRTFR
jgi:murein L,D-transpeptidase YcbB/YkuD